MIRKFVAEPSDKMNGLYDVTEFNEEKQVYLPFERDMLEPVAKAKAKSLKSENVFHATQPTDTYLLRMIT